MAAPPSLLSLLSSSLLVVLLLASLSDAKQHSFHPQGLVLPVSKDASTLQYITRINQRTPLLSVSVVLDLGGQSLWEVSPCGNSSTYQAARCHSSQCSVNNSTSCGECLETIDNTITHTATPGKLGNDVVSIQSTDGSNPGPVVKVSHFLFACAPTSLLKGLAKGTKGMAGLGRTSLSLTSQFSAAFGFHKKFAICLTSSPSGKYDGVLFFGDGSYQFLSAPSVNASAYLRYTKLYVNPVSTASAYTSGDASAEYFIGVKSIKVNEKVVPLNTSLLSINKRTGYGGTKISTVNPYTVMETSIYKAVTGAFIKAAASRNITRVGAVSPFGVCFSSKGVSSTRLGAGVPNIDLVLESTSVYWTIYGANSMVEVSDNVLCLGFLDGGSKARTSIVIGGYQLEDNLLEFDVASSKFGFSSLLYGLQTTCANFNFTSTA